MNTMDYSAAFPFVKNQQDTPDAFNIKTNDPNENPHDVDTTELRRLILQGKMTNYEQNYIDTFYGDEKFDPFIELSHKYKQKAEDYLQYKNTDYPDRYFILKKVAQNPEFWEICLHENIVLVNEDVFISKLQNQTEVFQKDFKQCYAKVTSDIKPISHFQELENRVIISDVDISTLKAFKIQWIATNPVSFDDVKFIRNSYNDNQQINMCKEFQEVHIFAAFLLLDIMMNPTKATDFEINPFNPVSQADNLTQSIYYIYNALQDKFQEQEKNLREKENEDEYQRQQENNFEEQKQEKQDYNYERKNKYEDRRDDRDDRYNRRDDRYVKRENRYDKREDRYGRRDRYEQNDIKQERYDNKQKYENKDYKQERYYKDRQEQNDYKQDRYRSDRRYDKRRDDRYQQDRDERKKYDRKDDQRYQQKEEYKKRDDNKDFERKKKIDKKEEEEWDQFSD